MFGQPREELDQLFMIEDPSIIIQRVLPWLVTLDIIDKAK